MSHKYKITAVLEDFGTKEKPILDIPSNSQYHFLYSFRKGHNINNKFDVKENDIYATIYAESNEPVLSPEIEKKDLLFSLGLLIGKDIVKLDIPENIKKELKNIVFKVSYSIDNKNQLEELKEKTYNLIKDYIDLKIYEE